VTTGNPFFDRPILNSPYTRPSRHWELDLSGQPTQRILDSRRPADFITPIPKPKKRKAKGKQAELVFDEGKGLSSERQQYDPKSIINEVRGHVETWRNLPNPSQWQVTPETARLLQHWRRAEVEGIRPCFCQVEAVTGYNEESFFVRHAYFLGANDLYGALRTTLKAEIDAEAWASLNSDTSRPFAKPKSGRIAVKVINHLGDEVMKVFRV
jgi:hypothetical protein